MSGCNLIPKLLKKGYHVKILDVYLFGEDVLDEFKNHPNLVQIKVTFVIQNCWKKRYPVRMR